MSGISTNEVSAAFEQAGACAGAERCKKFAEAMLKFYKQNNRTVVESGEGLVFFANEPPQVCPNRDQLFCQDRTTE